MGPIACRHRGAAPRGRPGKHGCQNTQSPGLRLVKFTRAVADYGTEMCD